MAKAKVNVPVPSFPVKETSLQEKLILKAQSWLEFSQPKLDRFVANFARDPVNALEWSADAFAAAGRVQIAKYVIEVLMMERDEPIPDLAEKLIKSFTEEVLRKARWPDRSTSVPSNEMSLSLNAARAEFIADIY